MSTTAIIAKPRRTCIYKSFDFSTLCSTLFFSSLTKIPPYCINIEQTPDKHARKDDAKQSGILHEAAPPSLIHEIGVVTDHSGTRLPTRQPSTRPAHAPSIQSVKPDAAMTVQRQVEQSLPHQIKQKANHEDTDDSQGAQSQSMPRRKDVFHRNIVCPKIKHIRVVMNQENSKG